MYVYNLKGMLKRRCNFNDMVDKYGMPNTVSNNGNFYVFIKPCEPYQINILQLTLVGFEYIRTIDFMKSITNYIQKL